MAGMYDTFVTSNKAVHLAIIILLLKELLILRNTLTMVITFVTIDSKIWLELVWTGLVGSLGLGLTIIMIRVGTDLGTDSEPYPVHRS